MATLTAGDTTTQLTLYLNTNAEGGEKHKRGKTALETSTALPATTEITVLLKAFIAR